MKTFVVLKSKIPNSPHTRMFETDDTLPLNVGDIFEYKAAEPNKNVLEMALRRIQNLEEDRIEIFNRYKIKDIQRRVDTSQEHFEKWGGGVKLIVESKNVSVYRIPNFLEDNVISNSIYLYVDIYDEAYIRNKKLEQIL